MWVYPAMTGSLVRSVWKTMQSLNGPFILQRNDTASIAMEEAMASESGGNNNGNSNSRGHTKRRSTVTATSHNSNGHSRSMTPTMATATVGTAGRRSLQNPIYRIITRNFPHYRVAEAVEWTDIIEDLDQLQQTVVPRIEGKLTSKKVVKWLRNWHLHGESMLPTALLKDTDSNQGIGVHTNQHRNDSNQEVEVDETGYASSSEGDSEEEEEEEEEVELLYSTTAPIRVPSNRSNNSNHSNNPLLLIRSSTLSTKTVDTLGLPVVRTQSASSLTLPQPHHHQHHQHQHQHHQHDDSKRDSDQYDMLPLPSSPLRPSLVKQHKRSWSAGSYDPSTGQPTSNMNNTLNESDSPALIPCHTTNHGKTRVYPKYPPVPPPAPLPPQTTVPSMTTPLSKSVPLPTNHSTNTPTLPNNTGGNSNGGNNNDVTLWDTIESYTRWVAAMDPGLEACLSPNRHHLI
ncbi:hypothetical protein BDF19DRAFT_20542 [Syncephalis fuscata]|nr:hypothetical protein BDF19DRAFT_20542 [Syncephalis fuscata]